MEAKVLKKRPNPPMKPNTCQRNPQEVLNYYGMTTGRTAWRPFCDEVGNLAIFTFSHNVGKAEVLLTFDLVKKPPSWICNFHLFTLNSLSIIGRLLGKTCWTTFVWRAHLLHAHFSLESCENLTHDSQSQAEWSDVTYDMGILGMWV